MTYLPGTQPHLFVVGTLPTNHINMEAVHMCADKRADRRPPAKHDAPEFTPAADASMTLTNDFRQALASTTTDNTAMSDTFPDQSIDAGQTSPSSHVSASVLPWQSQFDLSYAGEKMTVRIGQGAFTTDVTFDSADGRAGAVLAPTKPFSTDVDYDFYFFGGPGILPRLVNSFVTANLPAIVAYVAAHPISIDLGSDATLAIKTLNFFSDTVTCSYAALSPAQESDTQHWRVNAILNVTGSVAGTLSWKGVDSDFTVGIGGASILVQAAVDMSDPAKITCTIAKLACSISHVDISSVLTVLIQVLFPLLYAVIGSPYHLAGALNTTFNSAIVDAANAAIAKFLGSGSPFNFAAIIRHANAAISKSRHRHHARRAHETLTGYSTWMSNSTIQAKSLHQLTLPGTHDSGTYGLTPVLSQMSYPDIKFLWNLSPHLAPADGTWPLAGPTMYVGETLRDFVLESVLPISIAQDQTVHQQLDGGIRYFDLRIYHDTDGSFYTHHALRGPKFDDLLSQVRGFLDAHPASGELVFLAMSHTNFGDDPVNLPAAAAAMINDQLGPYLYMPAGALGVEDFDFQTLKDLTVGSITAGAPKVIVLNTDVGASYHFADTVVNTSAYAGSGRPAEGVDKVADLVRLEGEALDKNTEPLYQVSWTMTPQTLDIIGDVLQHLSGHEQPMLLGQFATDANSVLYAFFFILHPGRKCNLVMVDWYEVTENATPVDVVLSMNFLPEFAAEQIADLTEIAELAELSGASI